MRLATLPICFSRVAPFSYGHHFPIATLCGDAVFFTDRVHSKSTGCQKNIVRSAISHRRIIFVHEMPIRNDPATVQACFRANIDYWLGQIQTAATELAANPRLRSRMGIINNHVYRINSMSAALDIPVPDLLRAVLDDITPGGIAGYFQAEEERRAREFRRQRERDVKSSIRI